MANKQQFLAIMLAGLAAVVVIGVVAAQLLYFLPMENQYVVGGPEVFFNHPEPVDSGLVAIKEKLLKHPLYLNLQKFGKWPIELKFEKVSPGSPFIE